MIEIIGLEEFEIKVITAKFTLICCTWVCVLIAMLIDLYFGIQKSKSIGEHTTSEGFRRSIHKFVFYYATMLFALIFDVLFLPVSLSLYIAYILKIAPLFSIICAGSLVLTEAKSVREKADEKLRRKTQQSKKEIISGFFELMERKDSIIDLVKTMKNHEKNSSNTN